MTHDCYSTKRVTVWHQKRVDAETGAETDGHAIKYADGHISWCPEDVFDRDYNAVTGGHMTFGEALEAVKSGKRCRRVGWNGKGMFIFLVPGSRFKVNREPLLSILGEGTEVDYHGHVDMRTATGQIVPWLCSQTDMLADDWEEV